ncbi:MAG: response regulator [Melioribacteraceae bacterium]|nr:response regulator [Melioribacteraceae bacterium]
MKRMLIVEDDFLSQKVFQRLFKEEFKVDFCDSGDEYYKKFNSEKYDIIIMDVSLKGTKNGLELIHEIKSMPNKRDTPIICLTAHAFARDRTNAMESGADFFLTKPVMNETLLDVVKFLTQNK